MKLLSMLICLLACVSATYGARPNFVWIIADDMSPDIGAYKAVGINTPNLDRLAKEGRRYTRAYATAPVCSASRSAFILGCYQTTTGLHAHDVENPQPLPPPYQHLPGLLQSAGWYVTNAPAPGPPRNGRTVKKAKTHYNFAHDPAEMFDGAEWRERQPNQPFFAQFQISEPHRPFPIPEAFNDAALETLPLPANYPDHPLMRRDWYAYLRSVEMVDLRVGLILEQLEAEGVLDDTIVMFFADHGRPMPWGKQWLTVEGLQVPLIVRGPEIPAGATEERLVSLIDLAPSMLSRANLPVPAWMEGGAILGEAFPTRDHVFAARDRCGDAEDRIRAVITSEHLFVRNFYPELSRLNWSGYKEASYPGMPLLRILDAAGRLTPLQASWLAATRPEVELYDLTQDPRSHHNVAGEQHQQGAMLKLRKSLDTFITTTGDRGALPAVATEPSLVEIQKAKRADYERTWKARLKKADPTDAEKLLWWEKSYGLTSDDDLP